MKGHIFCAKLMNCLGVIFFVIATLVLYSDYIPAEVKIIVKFISVAICFLISFTFVRWSGELKNSIQDDPDELTKSTKVLQADLEELFELFDK